MNKNNLNYITDSIMFILMMAVIGIGLLMKFILVTGQERWIKYGRNVEETFMGLDRHGWGRIHLIIGLILCGMLILHLVLHWKSITRFFAKTFEKRALRISLVMALLLVSVLLLVFPFVVTTEVTALETGYGHQYRHDPPVNQVTFPGASSRDIIAPNAESVGRPETEPPMEEDHQQKRQEREALKAEIEVKGYMTLREVSGLYHVQADRIKERLGILLNTPDNDRLRQLRQQYGLTMSDVRDAIHAERRK